MSALCHRSDQSEINVKYNVGLQLQNLSQAKHLNETAKFVPIQLFGKTEDFKLTVNNLKGIIRL